MIRVRFAPTPAGYLYVSAARVALVNDLLSRRHGGKFLLRFDDTDPERCRPAHIEAIEQDLRWLGVEWNEIIRQSERSALYAGAIDRLKQTGRLYPCFESEAELKAKREFRAKRGHATIYDRAMLKLTPAQRAAAEAGGKRPHWRFKLSDRPLYWDDLALGPREAKLTAVSDPILVRADGSAAPLLASVVDDIDTGITHIVRAEENAGHTGVQIDLFSALGANPTRLSFAHLPPLGDGGKGRLGRRVASLSLRSLRNDGVEPQAIAACLAQTVAPGPMEPAAPAELAQRFELSRLPRAAVRFDAALLLALNRHILREMPFAKAAERLPIGATEAFWLAIRGNIDLLTEARGWWDVIAGTIVPPVMEGQRDVLLAAHALLPDEPWDATLWSHWIGSLTEKTGLSGDHLLLPLRLALTGEEHGPELADLLPLIGRTRAANRLQIAAA